MTSRFLCVISGVLTRCFRNTHGVAAVVEHNKTHRGNKGWLHLSMPRWWPQAWTPPPSYGTEHSTTPYLIKSMLKFSILALRSTSTAWYTSGREWALPHASSRPASNDWTPMLTRVIPRARNSSSRAYGNNGKFQSQESERGREGDGWSWEREEYVFVPYFTVRPVRRHYMAWPAPRFCSLWCGDCTFSPLTVRRKKWRKVPNYAVQPQDTRPVLRVHFVRT